MVTTDERTAESPTSRRAPLLRVPGADSGSPRPVSARVAGGVPAARGARTNSWPTRRIRPSGYPPPTRYRRFSRGFRARGRVVRSGHDDERSDGESQPRGHRDHARLDGRVRVVPVRRRYRAPRRVSGFGAPVLRVAPSRGRRRIGRPVVRLRNLRGGRKPRHDRTLRPRLARRRLTGSPLRPAGQPRIQRERGVARSPPPLLPTFTLNSSPRSWASTSRLRSTAERLHVCSPCPHRARNQVRVGRSRTMQVVMEDER